jgi:hypothetical protein
MATLQPIFNQILSGVGIVGKEAWVDLGLIPTGNSIWFGFATMIAEDKDLQFEIRCNTAGQSVGDAAHTMLHDYSSAQSGTSVDRDFNKSGYVTILTVTGTGVEHWWLRVRSSSQTSGNFDYIFYYATY